MVVVASLGVWLMTGPKQLTKLTAYIERSLNDGGTPYRTEIGDVIIRWDSITEPVDFLLKHVTVYSREEGARLLRLSEMSVGVSFTELLRFRLRPESVVLRQPRMRFYREEDGELYIGIGNDDSQRTSLSLLMDELGGDGSGAALIGNIRLIGVQNARLVLGKSGNERVVDAQDANLYLRRENGTITGAMDVAFRYKENRASYIRGDIEVKGEEDAVIAKFELRDFSPHILSQLFPQHPELAALDLPLTGWADMTMTDTGHVTLLDFRLQGREGTFAYEEHFAETIHIKAAKLEGQIREGFQQFMLKKGELDFDGATLSVNGIAHRYPKGWTADAVAVAENMPVNDLYKYWPKTLSPASYHWVTTRIREGVARAEARLKLTEEDIGEPFPELALAVEIQAEGVEVDYLEGHPKAHDVKGTVAFTGKGMTITSQQGRMLTGGVLKDALLQIPDLSAEPAPMHIRLQVEAPARDVASYIGIPPLDFAEPLGMDPKTIGGQAKGTLQFDFVLPDADVENDDPQLTFVIDAEVINASQPGFMGYEQVTDANGKLHITEKGLKYDGVMSISGAPLTITLTHDFAPDVEYPTVYRAKGAMTVGQLAAFGVPESPFLQGELALDAQIHRGGDKHRITARADLAGITVDVPRIGLQKAKSVPAMLDFEADIANGVLALRSFALKGDGLHITGAAEVRENISVLQALHLERVEYAENNFAMKIDRKDNGYRIEAKGASLDAQPLFAGDDATTRPQEKKTPLVVDVRGEFDWVVFGKERELRNVILRADCRESHCESLVAQGLIGQGNRFAFEVFRRDGVRQLEFSAQDAGGLLRALNFYDGMKGGVLRLQGRFDDEAEHRPFTGRLHITEHLITNAPVLARIASLLSLSGIADALQGKGINFREISGDIGYVQDVLTFRNGRAYGPSLGITVDDGAVHTSNKHVSVSGTVVPSYTLNTVLGNIPIIGEALSGGKGEGVFAATYKVEGQYPDGVEVSVNPLSMLAPGFLRNVFGGGTSAEEQVRSAAPEQEETVEESPAVMESPMEEAITPSSQ